jgi:hypothetical protein
MVIDVSTTHDAPARSTNVELRTVNTFLPDTRHSRTQIADSFVTPPLLDTDFQIVDGQHRLFAIAELQRSVEAVRSKRKVDVRTRRQKG